MRAGAAPSADDRPQLAKALGGATGEPVHGGKAVMGGRHCVEQWRREPAWIDALRFEHLVKRTPILVQELYEHLRVRRLGHDHLLSVPKTIARLMPVKRTPAFVRCDRSTRIRARTFPTSTRRNS